MKRAIVGLILLGLVGVSSAITVDYVTTGSHSWTDTGNWETNGVAYAGLPVGGDIVYVDGTTAANGAIVNTTTAVGGNTALGDNAANGHLTINEGAKLTLTATGNLTMGGTGGGVLNNAGTLSANRIIFGTGNNYITNSATGVMNLGVFGITMDGKNNSTFENSGIINAGTLQFDGAKSGGLMQFNMNGGAFNGTGKLGIKDSNADGRYTGEINLYGGTMTFTDVTYFDHAASTMDIKNDGKLIIEGTNAVSYFETAIASGQLTGVTALDVTFDAPDTRIFIRKGTVISIK